MRRGGATESGIPGPDGRVPNPASVRFRPLIYVSLPGSLT
jgi:hypothetical protein